MNTAAETHDFRTPNPVPQRASATGLPWLERVMFEHVELPRLVAHRPWHAARAAWFQTAHRSLDVARAFTPAQLAQPVAIHRLPGLEPRSTRYAAGEVLEHLIVANDGIAEVIAHLRAGEPHPGLKRTDALRPQGRLPMAETPAAFEVSLRELDARLAREGSASRLRARHPFFPRGLTAHEWLVLGWVHQVIHLKQLNAIARALCVPAPRRAEFDL